MFLQSAVYFRIKKGVVRNILRNDLLELSMLYVVPAITTAAFAKVSHKMSNIIMHLEMTIPVKKGW